MSQEETPRKTHYIHRLNYTTQERMVGAFVLVAIALVFALFLINSKTANLFEKEVYFDAYLTNAQGISSETPIVISGIDVGRVTDISITEQNRIHIRLMVYEKFHGLIREDSTAEIGKLSLVGRSAIEIRAGDPELALMAPNSVISVTEPVSIDEIIAQLKPVVIALEASVTRAAEIIQTIEPEKVDTTLDSLNGISRDLSAITAQIASGRGSVGMLLYDEKVRADLQQSVAEIDKIAATSSERLPPLMQESEDLIANLNTTVTSINVQMQQLPALVDKMNVLMEQTDRILDSVANSWPISAEETKRRQLLEAQPTP